MGAILRNTMFHYNIKNNYGGNVNSNEHYINGTSQQTGNSTSQEMERYLNQIIFEQPLHKFPFHFVAVYIFCIAIHVLFSVLYYAAFHPWKIIMGKKNSNENMEKGEREDISDHDRDESSPEAAEAKEVVEEEEAEEEEEETSHL